MVGLVIIVSIWVGISGEVTCDDPTTFQRNRTTFPRLALTLVHSLLTPFIWE